MADPVYAKARTSYEFMARWNPDPLNIYKAKLSGMHIGFRTTTYEDGVMIADSPDPVMPVALGLVEGFPLEEIMSQLQISLAVLCEEQQAQLNKRAVELQQLVDHHAEAMLEMDQQCVTEVARKHAQLTALTSSYNAMSIQMEALQARVTAEDQARIAAAEQLAMQPTDEEVITVEVAKRIKAINMEAEIQRRVAEQIEAPAEPG